MTTIRKYPITILISIKNCIPYNHESYPSFTKKIEIREKYAEVVVRAHQLPANRCKDKGTPIREPQIGDRGRNILILLRNLHTEITYRRHRPNVES